MKIFKKLISNNFVNYLITYILTIYLKFVFKTSKWDFDGMENIEEYYANQKPVIFIFWHGRISIMPNICPTDRKMNVIISTHRDGKFIANVMRNFKFGIIEGSTNKNSSQALRNTIKTLKDNQNVSITPDGPRGPRMRINSNIAAISGMTGYEIIPVTFSCKKYKIINSWDKLMFPFPFNKGIIIYGKSINIPNEKENFEDYRVIIENKLNDITFKADEILNIKDKIRPEE